MYLFFVVYLFPPTAMFCPHQWCYTHLRLPHWVYPGLPWHKPHRFYRMQIFPNTWPHLFIHQFLPMFLRHQLTLLHVHLHPDLVSQKRMQFYHFQMKGQAQSQFTFSSQSYVYFCQLLPWSILDNNPLVVEKYIMSESIWFAVSIIVFSPLGGFTPVHVLPSFWVM